MINFFLVFFSVPICMPQDGANFRGGEVATVSGWGRLKYGGGVPSVLQEVQVKYKKSFSCLRCTHKIYCNITPLLSMYI